MTDIACAPDAELRAFVHAQGLAGPGEQVRWTALAGGVSSDIWRVDLPGRSVCVKRALPKLRVAQDWRVPISRNAYEWQWLCFAFAHHPAAVPRPLVHDAALGAFAMQFLEPEQHPVWKAQLLHGIAEREFAARVGSVLAELHGASAGDPSVARSFATDAIFHAIRLEPYLLAVAHRHPDLASQLMALERRTAQTKVALVHGDVSPKNILVASTGPVFIDAECAWYGDPAFDLAFCLNHLLLKCVARPPATQGFLACFASLANAYTQHVTWEAPQALEARTATLLPALLLARVDGKSPVEYLTAETDRAFVRATARALLIDRAETLRDVVSIWRSAISKHTSDARVSM